MTTAIEVDPKDPKSVKVGSVHWRLWQSDSGWRYATRSGYLTDAQMDAGYRMTVDAADHAELERCLLAQSDAKNVEG